MTCSICMKRGPARVTCVVCTGAWCTDCHTSMASAFVNATLVDLQVLLEVDQCGMSCPFCRTVFTASTLHRAIADRRVSRVMRSKLRRRQAVKER